MIPLRSLLINTDPIAISVLYSTEKEAWLEEVMVDFEGQVNGRPVAVDLKPMGSREMYLAVLDGSEQPDLISPASSLQISILEDQSRASFGAPIVDPADPAICRSVVNTPLVLVAWRERADVLWGSKSELICGANCTRRRSIRPVGKATAIRNGASSSLDIPSPALATAGWFWTNNPYIILNAPWVTETQTAAAKDFEAFLLDRPQQERALTLGFRPADPSIPLGAPLDDQHGVDPGQPSTILEVPPAEIIENTQYLWRQVKRPVDLVLVVDTSGSMAGDKISAVRTSLVQFINLLASSNHRNLDERHFG